MSEIKKENQKLSVVKTGDERSPDTSYTEYLMEDAKTVPEFMVEETYEYLALKILIPQDTFLKNFLKKKETACGLESGNLLAE